MQKLMNNTNLEIRELSILTTNLISLIEDRFCHVEEHFPETIKAALKRFNNKLDREMEKRDM